MSRRRGPGSYDDRSLAISDHALDQVRLRAPGTRHLRSNALRHLIAGAVATAREFGDVEDHYIQGQKRARVSLMGDEVYVVLGGDTTGWSRGDAWSVVTVLTPPMIKSRLDFRRRS